MEPWIIKEILLSAVILMAFVFAPMATPLLIAFIIERTLPRRFLYVGVVLTMTYGLCLWLSLLTMPFEPILNFLAPQLAADNRLSTTQEEVLDALRWYLDKEFFVILAIQFAMNIGLSLYLRKRWHAIVAALAQ